ncbi:MAG TPA: Ig-like domain-containing protein, partial [Verrucomicrobiae bacterium]|nr:Ig-like domain-containing protein [Verrucomicrobiae bacterium]
WSFNTVSNTKTMIASGFPGQPDNIALDAANNRYYFTTGFDGTGDPVSHTPANYQAIYIGALGVTNAPTLVYTPLLTGQDTNLNAGKVAIQGIYVVDVAANLLPPVARTDYVSTDTNLTITLPVVDLVANDSDPNGDSLGITAVSSASTNGGNVALSGAFVDYTPVANYRGSDQFTYTLTDSGGAQAQGTVDVSVVPLGIPASNHLAVAVVPTGRLLLFNGAPGQSYMIQYANSLSAQWAELSPYLPAGPSGVIEYNDLLAPLPAMRFYRLHSQ